MARKLRIQYPGALFHVMNRGDRRNAIFTDDEDRERFLATLTEACQKTRWQVHAYCLMNNHFHLVPETPQPFFQVVLKPSVFSRLISEPEQSLTVSLASS